MYFIARDLRTAMDRPQAVRRIAHVEPAPMHTRATAINGPNPNQISF
jgi:hypothetical protein